MPPTESSDLEFFQLLEDHVVRHVVEESVCGRQDDVSQLDIKGGAVSSIRAEETPRKQRERDVKCGVGVGR